MSNFSAINYALSKKLDNAILSGVVSHNVDNVNKTITFTFSNGTSSTLQFNNPTDGKDGVGIATMYKDTSNHLIVTLTDGSSIDVGELPVGTVSGPLKEITNITYLDSKLTFTFSDGTNKIVALTPKLTELTDVYISSPTSGQVLVYNGATNKFINSSISTTDQYVKMTNADATGSYLADLIDNDSLVNNNNKLEVNKIKGQQITVDELNTLLGMDVNIKDSLNALATGGMVFKDVVPTKADLPQGALNGFVYIVNSDETDNGNRNAYIYSDVHGDYVLVGTSGLEVRNFTNNPINLETEVTGILPNSKIDTTGLVNKSTDVVSSLTYPIPDGDLNKIADLNVLKQINTEVANALNNKLDKSSIITSINDTVTNEQVASAKAVYDKLQAINEFDVKIVDEVLDLNNVTESGIYYFSSTYKPTNIPIGVNGWLLVIRGINEQDVKQIWYRQGTPTTNSHNTYERIKNENGWGEWTKFLTEKEYYKALDSGNTSIPQNADLNDYLTPGVYTCTSGSNAKTFANCPHIDSNFKLIVSRNTGTTDFYGYQMIVGTVGSNPVRDVCVYYRGVTTSSGTPAFSSWKIMSGSTVADVPITYINTFEDETYIKSMGNNKCSYHVINGNCVISLETVCLTSTDSFVQIISGLPKPGIVLYENAIERQMNSNSGARALFQLTNDGKLKVACNYGDTSISGIRSMYITFSYPVAEQ